jgi:Flp pilus assembly protein TadG
MAVWSQFRGPFGKYMNLELTSDKRSTAKRCSRGSAMLELALLGPWIFFLFIGALDWGFYAYALISLQSAARSAALYTSTSALTVADSATACSFVLAEMASLPNVGAACGSNPVVTATSVVGPDSATATQVSVTYTSLSMIVIPGLLKKQFTITRTVKMRLRG